MKLQSGGVLWVTPSGEVWREQRLRIKCRVNISVNPKGHRTRETNRHSGSVFVFRKMGNRRIKRLSWETRALKDIEKEGQKDPQTRVSESIDAGKTIARWEETRAQRGLGSLVSVTRVMVLG